jgi:hypothetical protein
MSLQQKLPLLMATILVVVLATSLGLTYRALTRASESALSERVANLSRQLGGLLENAMRTRTAQLDRVARDSVVHHVLRARPGSVSPDALDSLRSLLQSLRQPADSAMPVEVWTDDGRRVAVVGPAAVVELQGETHRMPRPDATAPPGDAVRYSPLFRRGGRAFYHVVAPVLDGRERLGYIVQMRQLLGGSAQAASQ